jgi:hypothetical protein
MNEQQILQQWAEQIDVGRRVLVRGFFFTGREFPGWELIKTLKPVDWYGATSVTTMWRSPQTGVEELIKIDMIAAPSWRQAHPVYLKVLFDHNDAHGTEFLNYNYMVGDMALLEGSEKMRFAVFARANMIVRVFSAGLQNVAIDGTARIADGLLIGRPEPTDEIVVPLIDRFALAGDLTGKEDVLPLDISLRDPLNRPVWYKLFAEQGEFTAIGDQVAYIPQALGGTITLYAFNENGGIAESTLVI